jgi:hypothetical protein
MSASTGSRFRDAKSWTVKMVYTCVADSMSIPMESSILPITWATRTRITVRTGAFSLRINHLLSLIPNIQKATL